MDEFLSMLPFLFVAMAANKKGIEAGRAYVKAWLDDSAISRGLKTLRGKFDSFSAGLASIGGKLLGAGVAAGSLFAAPLKRAAEMEMVAAGFESITGSAEAAAKVMADIRKFGVETPFEFPELADASRKLLAFGVTTRDLIPTLRAVGDVSSAIGAPIGEIAEVYGKAKVQGRLFAMDINQLTGRGIPIIQELAKQFGVTDSEVRDLVESGEVQFSHLEKAFQSLSGKGGKFFGMMDRQSRTLTGRLSNLKDAFWEAITPIGEALLPYGGRLLTVVSSLVAEGGKWIKANAAVAVKLAAVALAVMTLGVTAIAAALAIRGLTYVVGALGIALKILLLPAKLAIVVFRGLAAVLTMGLAAAARVAAAAVGLLSLALRTVAAAATLTAVTLRGFAVTIAASASALKIFSFVAYATSLAVTFLGSALQLTKRITASTAVTFRLVAAAVGLFGVATRLAAAAVVASSAVVRLAGAAFATFGAIVNATALAISGIGTVLMLLGNPVGGFLLALAAVAVAANYARGLSIDFGAALDWLKERFGPLADQAMAAFQVIKDAVMAGEWKTAGTLLWSGLIAAFMRGKIEVLKIWDDMTSGLRESLTKTLAGLAGKFTEWSYHAQAAAQDAYAVLLKAQAAFARLMGRDDMADTLDQEAGIRSGEFAMSGNLRRQAAGQGNKTEAGILAAGAKSVEDTKKLREQQEQEAEAAEQAFAASTAASKASVAAAQAAAAAVPGQSGTEGASGAKAAGTAKASTAINTAAVVGTQEGQDALFKALGGSVKGVTPGDRLIAEALDRQTAAMARQHREAMRNGGGAPLKVEKV